MHTLFLRLEGPLQSWGLRARWGERDTASEPTKSGVIGLLGCALGLPRDSRELRQLSDELHMGVRVDLPGVLLRDYHTTGGGSYGAQRHSGGPLFQDDPYMGGVLSAEVDKKGRIKVKVNEKTGEPETDVSNRFYLADASFLVALQGLYSQIERCAHAIQNPVWPYFLGRKACVPSKPAFEALGDYPDLRSALESRPFPKRLANRKTEPIRLLIEALPGQGNRQNDNIGVPSRRVFYPRFVQELWWALTAPQMEPNAMLPLPEGGAAPAINTLEG